MSHSASLSSSAFKASFYTVTLQCRFWDFRPSFFAHISLDKSLNSFFFQFAKIFLLGEPSMLTDFKASMFIEHVPETYESRNVRIYTHKIQGLSGKKHSTKMIGILHFWKLFQTLYFEKSLFFFKNSIFR